MNKEELRLRRNGILNLMRIFSKKSNEYNFLHDHILSLESHLSTLEAKEQIEAENKQMREIIEALYMKATKRIQVKGSLRSIERCLICGNESEYLFCLGEKPSNYHSEDCLVPKIESLLEESKNE